MFAIGRKKQIFFLALCCLALRLSAAATLAGEAAAPAGTTAEAPRQEYLWRKSPLQESTFPPRPAAPQRFSAFARDLYNFDTIRRGVCGRINGKTTFRTGGDAFLRFRTGRKTTWH